MKLKKLGWTLNAKLVKQLNAKLRLSVKPKLKLLVKQQRLKLLVKLKLLTLKLLDDAKARAQAEAGAKEAADAASSSQDQGIFVQLPGLDALSAKIEAAAEANVMLVDSLKEAQTSIHNTILSNKPDLSSVTNEMRSLLQTQATKIDNQQGKLDTLTTLVNGQGTQIQELKDMVPGLPKTTPAPSPSFTSEERKTLTDHSNILTSQATLLNTICTTL